LYCKILSKVNKTAKKLHYDKIILNSKNETKTTWNIVKAETGKNESKEGIYLLNIKGVVTHNRRTIADLFNDYFLAIADKVINNNRNINIGQSNNNNNNNNFKLHVSNFKRPFPSIKFNYTSTKGIKEIIKSLKKPSWLS
jgi:hypothetical protein